MNPTLQVAALLAVVVGCAPRVNSPQRYEAASEIGSDFLERWAYWNPDRATWLAYPGADHAKLPDVSPQALRAWEAEQDEFQRRTRHAARDPGMSDLDRVSSAILLEWLESSAAARSCRFELWALGWQSRYSQLARLQPVDTPEHRAAALSRLRALLVLVDQEIANLREGVRLGYLASRGSVERALTELDALVALPPVDWPFLDPAKRASNGQLAAEMEREIAERLAPATRGYRDFLRTEHLPRSRTTTPGVHANRKVRPVTAPPSAPMSRSTCRPSESMKSG